MNNKKINVLIVGPLPDPCGGVAVHIIRLCEYLRGAGIDCLLLNTNRLCYRSKARILLNFRTWKIIFKLLAFKGDIVHFNVSSMNNFYLLFFILFLIPARKIVTIHSGHFTDSFLNNGKLKKMIIKQILLNLSHIITVNDSLANFLVEQIGVQKNKITTIADFLPPIVSDDADGSVSVKDAISDLRKKVKKIAMASGLPVRNYNLLTVFNAFEALKRQNIDIGLVLALYDGANDETYKNNLISKTNRVKDVKIFENLKPNDFCYLIRQIDIFIRATEVDGASVALSEAMYFKKQIIASDSACRPAGIQLYKHGDEQNLAKNMMEATANDKIGVSNQPLINAGDEIISIYNLLTR